MRLFKPLEISLFLGAVSVAQQGTGKVVKVVERPVVAEKSIKTKLPVKVGVSYESSINPNSRAAAET